jgi:hypothetical protein
MKLISYFVTPWPVILFIAFQFTDPGEIFLTNILSYMKRYPPDNFLYIARCLEGTTLPIVPRSRYCSKTNRWIAKFDHYCPWVAQPIGERTFRLFLAFLVSCLAIAVTGWVGFTHFFWKQLRECPDGLNWKNGVLYVGWIATENLAKLVSWSLTVAVNIVLMCYLVQLGYQVSVNQTSIEWWKRRQWRREHPNEKLENFYDKGMLENWKLMLFPKRVESHPKVEVGE